MKQQAPNQKRSTKSKWLNLAFIAACLAVLIFLMLAPDETTPHLPKDEVHAEFFKIKSKKEADSHCASCHSDNGGIPLPENHPPPYRCLFCHKRS